MKTQHPHTRRRRAMGAVVGLLLTFTFLAGSFFRVFSYHGIEGIKEMFGDAFAGGVLHDGDLEQAGVGQGLQLGKPRVIGSNDGGVVQIFVDPVGKVMKFAEIDDKTMLVQLIGSESKRDGPAVAVYA